MAKKAKKTAGVANEDGGLDDGADMFGDEEDDNAEVTVVVAEINYDAMTSEQVLEAMGEAFKAKDMKLVGRLSKLFTKKEAEAEKTKRDALQIELQKTVRDVRIRLSELVQELEDSGILDGADGIWFAYDFGDKRELGINPSCRITRTQRKAASEGSPGKSSYVANPAKSADLLAQVGDRVMFAAATTVTIDKVEQTMPAGTTFKEAYEFSTNGGWRNRVRMALLKEAGII